jgi:uncharacterized protein YunC (DUF1805 family)
MCLVLTLSFLLQTKMGYALKLVDFQVLADTPIIITPEIDWDNIYSGERPLSVYDNLIIQNTKDYIEYNGWQYLDFLSMKLHRNDGRPIYDNEGYLTFSDPVNYESQIDITTKLMQHKNDGFLGSTLNSKLKNTSLSAPFLELKYIDIDSRLTSFSYLDTGSIHDLNQNIGSGNYVNNGINPGIETYKFADIDIENITEPMLAQIYFQGRAYWENAWWGGTGNELNLYESISSLFKIAKRDWNNGLLVQDDLIASEHLDEPIYYYHKPFVVTASNLSNHIKLNDELVTPIENDKIMPYKNGHRIMIDNGGLTKIELESGSENSYETYYVLIDDSVPQVTLNTTNENALKQYEESDEVVDANGFITKNIYATYRQPVQINFDTNENESLETATYTFNSQTYNLLSGDYLEEDGEYVITVTDLIGHVTNIYLTINTTLDFSLMVNEKEISTTQAEYINQDVTIISNASLSIEVLKDEVFYDYNFGQVLASEGKYKITIFDDSNNVKSFNITIDKTQPKVTLINVENNGATNQTVRLEFLENDINAIYYLDEILICGYLNNQELIQDGNYQIKVQDLASNEVIVNFRIDTIAPTLELLGVQNGGQTQYEVSTTNLSEPAQIILTKDTLKVEYEEGQILKAVGNYEMVLVDEAGNETTYTFEIIFVLNAAAIGLFAGLVALAVAGTIFLIKTREVYYF